MRLDELQPLRGAALLLALNAICRADDKDYHEAIKDMNAIFRMVEQVGAEQILVSMLVSAAIDRVGIETLGRVLASGQALPADLAAIQLSDTMSYRAMLRRAYRMEEAFQLATVAQVGSGTIPFAEVIALSGGHVPRDSAAMLAPVLLPLYRVFLLGDDLATEARFADRVGSTAEMPYAEAKETMQQLERELKAESGVLTRMLLPGLDHALSPQRSRMRGAPPPAWGWLLSLIMPATAGIPTSWTTWPPTSFPPCPRILSPDRH